MNATRYVCASCAEALRRRLSNHEIEQFGVLSTPICPAKNCDCGARAEYIALVTENPPG